MCQTSEHESFCELICKIIEQSIGRTSNMITKGQFDHVAGKNSKYSKDKSWELDLAAGVWL